MVNPGTSVTLKSFKKDIGRVKHVKLLGKGSVKFIHNEEGLTVSLPEDYNPELGYVLQIDLKK